MKQSCLAILFFLGTAAFGQVLVTDASINAGETLTLTADNEYLLDGFVFVEAGATLNIEPGTVIRGKNAPTTGDNASALIIARDATINANGTADAPIIMTSEFDDLNDPFDLTWQDRGLWGGLIVLGNAEVNRGEVAVEGIPTGEARALYGGNNNEDSSGVIRYVSVRHSGAELAPGNEINGVTMGGVGSGTIIEYVEVYANLDDGFEWFGGRVNTKYLVGGYNADDTFDWDSGWIGNNQFWFAIQGPDKAGRIAEMDGRTETGATFSNPTVSNVTLIGPGIDAVPEGDGSEALIFRDNTGALFTNSIITEYNGNSGGIGVTVDDNDEVDSEERLAAGDLVISNNLWWDFAAGNTIEGVADQVNVQTHLLDNGNQIIDPQLTNVDREQNGLLDPRPAADGPAAAGATAVAGDFFTDTGYYGAFDPAAPLWIQGWTALSDAMHIGSVQTTNIINDASINAGETVTLTADTEWTLDGFVFVEAGATLIIEPGTVIKALETPSTDDNASALIIARDATIIANGNRSNPIIMTSADDDLNDPNDLIWSDRGKWGGLIILGNGIVNRGEVAIEGIPTGEARALYGGDNNADSSGILRYISVRHAGAALAPGNEINGITFGAVGSGTVAEYLEVWSNEDDGFEWFGGAVNTRYLVSAFCGDDAFDWDAGWVGKNQFWFAIQGPDKAGRIAEMDGRTETGAPFATPYVFNATYIGPGVDAIPEGDGSEALIFRDNTGGQMTNSIITQYNGNSGGIAITVDDSDEVDSIDRLAAGDLVINNNLWWDFQAGNTLPEIAPQDEVEAHLAANGNQIVDPQIVSISRDPDGSLDPRPTADGPAASGAVMPNDSYFEYTKYYGAFEPNAPLWISNWTALDAEGHLVAQSFESARMINHVTASAQDFTTTINMVNTGDATENVILKPYAADGTALTEESFEVGGQATVSVRTAIAFPGEEVSHIEIGSNARVRVNAGYKVSTTTGASGHISESTATAQSFIIVPGEVGVVFDGAALVNHGSDEATVMVYHFDAAGALVGSYEAGTAPANGKLLINFSAIDLTGVANVRVESTQPMGHVFLRGSTAGADVVYLYQNDPMTGN